VSLKYRSFKQTINLSEKYVKPVVMNTMVVGNIAFLQVFVWN